MNNSAIIEVSNLTTVIETDERSYKAVDNVSFTLNKGRVLGLVGESGSGKSTVAFSIMGLLDAPLRIRAGRVMFKGKDLLSLSAAELQQIRGSQIAMIFQDPMMTLNPVLTIGAQIIEAILAHRSMSYTDAWTLARDTMGRVGIASPEERMIAYPHQFSGGMRQRVAIAIALVNDPELIIADEPTTALDVTIQGQILAEIQALCEQRETALLWITHDLSVVSGLADEVAVMYAGQIVENGPVDNVLNNPVHPYTRGLINSVPLVGASRRRLLPIRGTVPPLSQLPQGCPFSTRCDCADSICAQKPFLRKVGVGHLVSCHHPLAHSAGSPSNA